MRQRRQKKIVKQKTHTHARLDRQEAAQTKGSPPCRPPPPGHTLSAYAPTRHTGDQRGPDSCTKRKSMCLTNSNQPPHRHHTYGAKQNATHSTRAARTKKPSPPFVSPPPPPPTNKIKNTSTHIYMYPQATPRTLSRQRLGHRKNVF